MGNIADGFTEEFRDFELDGDPSSGIHRPAKAGSRALGQLIEDNTVDLLLENVDPDAKPRFLGTWIEGAPSILKTFMGDGSDALYAFYAKITGSSTTTNEIGGQIEMVNTVGVGGGKQYVIAFFASMVAGAGSCAAYAANFVLRTAGPPSAALELNVDNTGVDSGDGAAQNSSFGVDVWINLLNLITAGTKRLMAAIHIEVPVGYGQLLNRGLSIIGNCIRRNSIEDTASGMVGYKMGGAKGIGIDMEDATFSSTYAVTLPGSTYIGAFIGGTRTKLAGTNGLNAEFGFGAAKCFSGSHWNPGATNAFYLGEASFVWAGGTIQTAFTVTSDPRLKTDASPLPSMLEAVRAITPKSYRMREGGNEPVERISIGPVHQRDPDTGELLYDEVPDLDEDGQKVFLYPWHFRKKQPITRTRFLRREIKPVLRTKLVPRMAPGEIKDIDYIPRPGRRLHWGFMSDDIKANLMDRTGLDFGGWVKDLATPDGYEGLRYDQLIAPLWKATQELADVVDEQRELIDRLIARLDAVAPPA